MSHTEQTDTLRYKVVANQEEQYSIWPSEQPSPLGWREVGQTGSKDECLNYIQQVWTDMRPLSLRQPVGSEYLNPLRRNVGA